LSAAGWLAVLACAALLPLRPAPAGQKRPPADDAAPQKQAPPAPPAAPAAPPRPEALFFEPRPVTLQVPPLIMQCVALSPDGRPAAAACGTQNTAGEVRVWDRATGQAPLALREPRGVRCVAFSPDGALLAAGDFDNLIKLREPASGKLLAVLRG